MWTRLGAAGPWASASSRVCGVSLAEYHPAAANKELSKTPISSKNHFMHTLTHRAHGLRSGCPHFFLLAFLTTSAFILSTTAGTCSVSSSSNGRGTEYSTSRGGSAYVGPHGAAAKGANGNSAAATKNGTTATGKSNGYGGTNYSTSNGGKAYVGPNGAAAKGPNGNAAVATRNGYATSTGNGSTSYNSYHGTSVHYNSSYPHGYYSSVPPGYRHVYYGGYNCYYVGGIYYRPTYYQGTTIYIVVQ